jgi:hypothetical protein
MEVGLKNETLDFRKGRFNWQMRHYRLLNYKIYS